MNFQDLISVPLPHHFSLSLSLLLSLSLYLYSLLARSPTFIRVLSSSLSFLHPRAGSLSHMTALSEYLLSQTRSRTHSRSYSDGILTHSLAQSYFRISQLSPTALFAFNCYFSASPHLFGTCFYMFSSRLLIPVLY